MGKLTISWEESTALKGLLIILIIIGHCQPLTHYSERLWFFIYSFHVVCFFILPLLYPVKTLTKKRIGKYFVKLMWPYIYLYISFALVLMFFYRKYTDVDYIVGCISTLFTGGLYPIGQYAGLKYLWFMPVMFSFSVIKDYYYTKSSKAAKTVLISLGLFSYIFLWVFLYGNPWYAEIRTMIMKCSPFSILQSFGALFIGILTIRFLKIIVKRKYSEYLLLLFFAVLSITFFFIKGERNIWVAKSICFAVNPLLFFSLLYLFRHKISRLKFLHGYGQNSFAIYLVQTPICVCTNAIINRLNGNFYIGILATIFVIFVSYYVAKWITEQKKLKRILCPSSWEELIGLD